MHNSTLQRNLNTRILTMITLGGSIGTGIFLASGNTLAIAGPGGTLLAYFIMAIVVYFLMTSLGEMAAFMPSTGSFSDYATRFLDPSLGYALGWNYWYSCAIYIASEVSAAALIMHLWFPDCSPMLWCALFLSLIIGFNAISTRVFGEVEYWLSFIKITVVILFIIAGFILATGITNYEAGGFQNWNIGDAPFHGGWGGILAAFVVAGFSFQGTELIGIAAGESDNPGENIPKAINMVFWRLLIFFILSLFIISLLIPYTSPQLMSSEIIKSPFTLVFEHYDKSFAAVVMNGVILVAIVSTANSNMYVGSRILWHLAKQGHAPKFFTGVSKRGIPMYTLALTSLVSMMAFLSSIFGSSTIYLWLLNATSLSGFITWTGIAISHYRFRKAYVLQGKDPSQLPYLAKGYPFRPLCAFAICILVIGCQNYAALTADPIDWYGLFISYIGIPLFLLVWIGHKLIRKTKSVSLMTCQFHDQPASRST